MDSGTGFVILAALLVLYFLPTVVAKRRGAENPNPTFIVNLFLGWTFLGWVVALAMGAGAKTRQRPPGELEVFAERVRKGEARPSEQRRVVAKDAPFVLRSADIDDESKLRVPPGTEVEIHGQRGEFFLIREPLTGLVGWLGRSSLSALPSSPGPQPTSATKVCPECAETVQAAAKICRFCRHEFS